MLEHVGCAGLALQIAFLGMRLDYRQLLPWETVFPGLCCSVLRPGEGLPVPDENHKKTKSRFVLDSKNC